MAATNHERVTLAMEALKAGLAPFVGRECVRAYQGRFVQEIQNITGTKIDAKNKLAELDTAGLLKVMWERWSEVFRDVLGNPERNLVGELRGNRNDWAHQANFSTDDTHRVLDSTQRLLTSVSAPQAADVGKLKDELLRLRFAEEARNERRRTGSTAIENQVVGDIKPWRDVINPHTDVATGRYQQAEFAADLWQVYLGEGSDEYRDPKAFYQRTYLTEGLSNLLESAARRISGSGGAPVVQLQTNFGGGKTHAMLALYHLLSGVPSSELSGIEDLLSGTDITIPNDVKRVVLVGNKISPGEATTKPDGTVVNTLWGELAWQLGGKEAYSRVKTVDENATNPGDTLRELMNDYGPSLILIDEWVSYARQLHDQPDLPGGDFDTHFTFAQTLTESANAASNCVVVISLPASNTTDSPDVQVDDLEVGGTRGEEALRQLSNVIGRVESPWKPATADEGFEIVRMRLFEPIVTREAQVSRDNVVKAFLDLYRTQSQEFPPECQEADYEKRMVASYPIHPEVFDRLYNDWSTLVTFQRTRGVLRLMASVIHSLWEKGDRSPLIMPSNIPMDDSQVQAELTRYLPDAWIPVIGSDIDGPNSLPIRIDGEVANLGRFSACRRVARTIYLGSAPTANAANLGIEDRRVKLGCVMPGEAPTVFGDALRRISGAATYLYQDNARYWYSTQPTVTKLAEDRAELFRRDRDKVIQELESRIRRELTNIGEFKRVHPLPHGAHEVTDDTASKLVVLGVDHTYTRDPDSLGELAAKNILESRGAGPRIYRNTLVFLAPDKARLEDLEDSTRKHLAWQSIIDDKDQLDLTQAQIRQAEDQKEAADGTTTVRISETYQWLLVPTQSEQSSNQIEFRPIRLSGQDPIAVRASKRLVNEELLITNYSPTLLRMEMDRAHLWRANADHVPVRLLGEDFASYFNLPRLQDSSVLGRAVEQGISLLTWEQDSFAFADGYDEAEGRYQGLRAGQAISVSIDGPGLLVKPDVARKQIELETQKPEPPGPGGNGGGKTPPVPPEQPAVKVTKRYHASVKLDPLRPGRDASQIAEEVISHLSGLLGANVEVRLEIQAYVPDGVPDNVERIVIENGQTLKFENHGFEEE